MRTIFDVKTPTKKTPPPPPPAAAAPKRKKPLLDLRDAFLAAFRACCSVTEAAEAVQINRSQHYRWMEEPDGKYRLRFEALLPEAAGVLEDIAVAWVRRGLFEPEIYKGRYQYEPRERVRCILADGTEEFEDKLPTKHPKIISRRTVMTADGAQIGTYRKSERVLGILLAAHLPEKYGNKVAITGELEITDPDDAKRELIRLVAGLTAAEATKRGNSEPG